MHRVEKNDDEGNYRALAFLWESITDYFLLRDLFYFGSKKAVAYLKESDAEGYRLYHDAITDRTNVVLRRMRLLRKVSTRCLCLRLLD